MTHVRGCTALLDAIGYGVEKMVNIQRHLPENERAEKVIFVITTDGLENASKRFSYEKIRRMIEREKERYGWEFLFLGANMDAVQEAARFGIGADRAVRFENDAQVLFRSGKPSSKLRVPFIPDANVGTDDLSAQRRRGFCDMQRLIAVEGYGQIRMGSTLGNLAGVRIDAAGQVYGQHKGTALVQTAYQPAGSKAGRPQFTMEPGAVEGIHNGSKALGFQYRTVSADVHRQGVQTLKIEDGISSFRLALGQKNGHIPAVFCCGAGNHKPIAAVVALSADHQQPAGMRELLLQFSVSSQSGIFHHLQVGQTVGIPGSFNFLHLRSRHNAMFHVGTFFLSLL